MMIYIHAILILFGIKFLSLPIDFGALLYSIQKHETNCGMSYKPEYHPEFYDNYPYIGIMSYVIRYRGFRQACTSYSEYHINLTKAYEHGFDVSPRELEKYSTVIASSILCDYCRQYGWNMFALSKVYSDWSGRDDYAAELIRYYMDYLNMYWWGWSRQFREQ